jgi:cutinase
MNGTGQLAIQGVDYPANIAGFLAGGSPVGSMMMYFPSFPSLLLFYKRLTPYRAALINTTLSRCPSTLLTLSGYSQGAQLIHNTLPMLPSSTTSQISSIVLFGDPKNGTQIQNVDNKKVYTICHAGDDICKGGSRIGVSHLDYSLDARIAAGWVVNGRGMGMLGISSMRVKRVAGGGLGSG